MSRQSLFTVLLVFSLLNPLFESYSIINGYEKLLEVFEKEIEGNKYFLTNLSAAYMFSLIHPNTYEHSHCVLSKIDPNVSQKIKANLLDFLKKVSENYDTINDKSNLLESNTTNFYSLFEDSQKIIHNTMIKYLSNCSQYNKDSLDIEFIQIKKDKRVTEFPKIISLISEICSKMNSLGKTWKFVVKRAHPNYNELISENFLMINILNLQEKYKDLYEQYKIKDGLINKIKQCGELEDHEQTKTKTKKNSSYHEHISHLQGIPSKKNLEKLMSIKVEKNLVELILENDYYIKAQEKEKGNGIWKFLYEVLANGFEVFFIYELYQRILKLENQTSLDRNKTAPTNENSSLLSPDVIEVEVENEQDAAVYMNEIPLEGLSINQQ